MIDDRMPGQDPKFSIHLREGSQNVFLQHQCRAQKLLMPSK